MTGTTGTNGATSGEPTWDTTDVPGPAGAYRERLWPAVWIWAALALLAGLVGVVVLPLGSAAGAVAFLAALAAFGTLMVTWSPTVTLTDGELVAGRAHIPVELLGDVTFLNAAAMRQALGPDLDMRAYLCFRGWITTGLRVELADPDDPTPYWLISSRHPLDLAGALQRARRAARPSAS